jgi:hypothetical protein
MAQGDRSILPASYQFEQLQRDLNRMGPAMRKRIRARAEQVGQSALSDARSRAGAWSRRIPAAITMRGYTDVTRGRVGVQLRVGVAGAPHARPYEGISQQGSTHIFRHPVYPDPERPRNEWNWVSQSTRPFLWPAVQGRANGMRTAMEQATEDAARECGFR